MYNSTPQKTRSYGGFCFSWCYPYKGWRGGVPFPLFAPTPQLPSGSQGDQLMTVLGYFIKPGTMVMVF